MSLTISNSDATFLATQLKVHMRRVEGELVRTDRREMQHSLALDLSRLELLHERMVKAAATSEGEGAEMSGAPADESRAA